MTSEVGTLDTLAGPGFCFDRTFPDPTSASVRALAVDEEGALYADVGPADAGLIRKADGSEISVIRSGFPSSPERVSSDTRVLPKASRLAPDGTGGILVAGPGAIMDVTFRPPGVAPLAGVAPVGTGDAGDTGPISSARFKGVRSIAADDAHNLYVADATDPGAASYTIRFLNRGKSPVTFYPGTRQALTVLPGHIDTVAGVSGGARSGDRGPARQAVLAGAAPALAVSGAALYLADSAPGDEPQASPGVRVINLTGEALTTIGITVAAGAIDGLRIAAPSAAAGGSRSARVSYFPGIAADHEGNLFLADLPGQRVLRVAPDGAVSTFAGTGQAGYNGNGRPATEARLDRPFDVKVDAGRVYISDQGNGQLRVVDANGVIHSAPGNTRSWSCPPARAGREVSTPGPGNPPSVRVSADGEVLFAAPGRNQILKLDSSGMVTAVVGAAGADQACSAPECRAGDLAPIRRARLDRPSAITVAPRGGLYILDSGGGRLSYANLSSKRVSVNGVSVPPGFLARIAGGSTPGTGGDRAPGGLPFGGEEPGALTAGPAGDVFVTDGRNARVLRIDPKGVASMAAGSGARSGGRACCDDPAGLALDSGGNLYVSDSGSRRVWLVNRGSEPLRALGQSVPAGGAVPVAGNGRPGEVSEGGAGQDSSLPAPRGIALDGRGNLYIAEAGAAVPLGRTHILVGNSVQMVDANGKIATVAGTGQPGFNGDGLKARVSTLNSPADVAVDACGDLLIADSMNDRVRSLRLAGSCPRPARPEPPRPVPWIRLAGLAAALALIVVVALTRLRPRAGPS